MDKSYEAMRMETERHNEEFRKTHSKKLKAWMEQFPNRPAPVILDNEGKMHWLDRRNRNKYMKSKNDKYGKKYFK